MKLINKTSQKEICAQVENALSYRSRLQGLIGTKKMDNKAFVIPRCNWIHTFFMSIPIDVIYIDKNWTVRKIQKNLKPWVLPAPVWQAHAVIELASGVIEDKNIRVGDQLHVGD